MKRTAIIIGIVLAMAFVAGTVWWRTYGFGALNSPLARTETEQRILTVLEEVRKSGRTWASVPMEDGRALRPLAEAIGAKTVVEIGTSTGYSGLWLCLALQSTGGKLVTFELDPGRAATAREHFRKAGVEHMVTLVEGDAHNNVSRLQEPIDLVFMDADKGGYVDYLNKLLPLVRPGGLILAHNVSWAGFASGYVKAVTTNPDLETIFYMEGNGLSVTLKKR